MEIEMIVEIAQGSRNKYEMDHETGAIWLDRTLFTPPSTPSTMAFFLIPWAKTVTRSMPSSCFPSPLSLAATCGHAPLACSG